MAETLFEWDETNLEHLEKHGFSREDAEAAIIDLKRVSSFAKQDSGGGRRFGVVGRRRRRGHLARRLRRP